MTLTRIDTATFSDVAHDAEAMAKDVEDLKSDLSSMNLAACRFWVGDGREGFNNLYTSIEMQMKDISEEFWDLYDTILDIEVMYMEADQEIATQLDSSEMADVDGAVTSA